MSLTLSLVEEGDSRVVAFSRFEVTQSSLFSSPGGKIFLHGAGTARIEFTLSLSLKEEEEESEGVALSRFREVVRSGLTHFVSTLLPPVKSACGKFFLSKPETGSKRLYAV